MSNSKELKKFRIVSQHQIYMHKSVANGAWALKTRIEEREKNKDIEGILYDYWSCLIFISYWQEAIFYFYGDRQGYSKNTKEDFWKMVKKANASLKLGLEKGSERNKLIGDLRKIRNTLAHGKPLAEQESEEFIATSEDATKRIYELRPEAWQENITLDFLTRSYKLTEDIEEKLYRALNLHPDEISTGTFRQMQYLGPAGHQSEPA
ncbi:hypothetical protein ACNT8L_18270 [Brucella intermedia]|uniref:hypothetical protein n=1 Tax=Brucella intermedia TaxID=94625 RepID=UPI003AB7D473